MLKSVTFTLIFLLSKQNIKASECLEEVPHKSAFKLVTAQSHGQSVVFAPRAGPLPDSSKMVDTPKENTTLVKPIEDHDIAPSSFLKYFCCWRF